MEDLISVIVPVYNVQEYLNDCMNSIINQKYTNLEIILIDDGSTDNSSNMCDSRSQKDLRIKVIHQQNGGLSCARNTGLDNIKGKYIVFVDSDDAIHPNFIYLLYHACIKNKTLVATCKHFTFTNEINTFAKFKDTAPQELVSKKVYLKHNTPKYVRNKIYHKSIFNNLRFKEGMIFEDIQIFPYIINKVDSIVILHLPLYGYRQRKGSTVFIVSKKHMEDAIYACKENEKFYLDIDDIENAKKANSEYNLRKVRKYSYFRDISFLEINKVLLKILQNKEVSFIHKVFSIIQVYFPFPLILNKLLNFFTGNPSIKKI